MKNSNRMNRFNQPFNPNSQNVITLPTGGKILKGQIVLTGTVTLATTAAGTVLGSGTPARLIKRIQVNANPAAGPNGPRYPGGTILDAYPDSLLRYARTQRWGQPLFEQSGNVLGSGASGTYPIYMSIPIYWANSRLKRGIQTALNADSSAFDTIQVVIKTADITNVFSGWTGTVTYNLSVQWIDDRENFSGDTYVVFQEDHDFLIPATAQRALDLAMPQSGAFESWLIQALASAQENLSDSLLNRLRINGDAIDYDKYAQDIREDGYDDRWFQVGSTPTGLYFVDFTDGLVGGTIAAPGLQFNFDDTNVSGANLDKLRFYTRRLMQPAGMTVQTGPSAAKNQ